MPSSKGPSQPSRNDSFVGASNADNRTSSSDTASASLLAGAIVGSAPGMIGGSVAKAGAVDLWPGRQGIAVRKA